MPKIKDFYILSRCSNTQVSTCNTLSHKTPDSHINITIDFGSGAGMIPLHSIVEKSQSYKPKEKVTYKMIQHYVEEKYGFKVHTAYIAEVKRDLGLPMYNAPNAVDKLKQPRKHPTPIQVTAIKDSLEYFEVIYAKTKGCLLLWSRQPFYIDYKPCSNYTKYPHEDKKGGILVCNNFYFGPI